MNDRKGMLAQLTPELLAVATHDELVSLIVTLAAMVDSSQEHLRMLESIAAVHNSIGARS